MIQISVSDIYDPNKMTVLSENERTVFCFLQEKSGAGRLFRKKEMLLLQMDFGFADTCNRQRLWYD